MRALAVALVSFAALVAQAPRAAANGRFPAAQFVVAQGRTVALRTTFGVLVSDDAGGTWSWLCEEAFGFGGRELWDPPVALGGAVDGRAVVFVGGPDGLWRDGGRCAPSRVPEVGREFTGDVTADASGERLYWASSGAGRPSALLASDDGGRTWSRRYAGPSTLLFQTVESAPSRPSRVYLTAIDARDTATRLYRSDDGGRSLEAIDLDLRGGRDAFLAGVDPARPDVLWLRVPVQDDAGALATLLLESRDGGRRYEVRHRTRGPMLGFAYSGDGRTLWAGGPDDGLLRAVDGGPFERVSEAPVRCLRWHEGTLYVCEDLLARGVALSRSRDGGATREALLRVDALTGAPATCGASSPLRAACDPRWAAVRRALTAGDAGLDAGDGASTRGASTTGGGCSVGDARGGVGAWAWCCGVALALRRRRRQQESGAAMRLRQGTLVVLGS